jgi:hypothetical protein
VERHDPYSVVHAIASVAVVVCEEDSATSRVVGYAADLLEAVRHLGDLSCGRDPLEDAGLGADEQAAAGAGSQGSGLSTVAITRDDARSVSGAARSRPRSWSET